METIGIIVLALAVCAILAYIIWPKAQAREDEFLANMQAGLKQAEDAVKTATGRDK